jgi:hypothetical protein
MYKQLQPIVVVPKKNGKLKICIDFKNLNVAAKKNPYSLPFIVARYETYSFLNEYLRYHQIFIVPKDKYKTTFITGWGFLYGR